MLEWFDSTAIFIYYYLRNFFRLNTGSERDGMVDMSGLDSGDICRVGSSPAARIFYIFGV